MAKRTFSLEFKESAVKLVQERGYTIVEAAKSLGIDGNSLRGWLKKFPADAPGKGVKGDQALRAEIQRLRKENQRLMMDREILKKATAFFAKQQS
jgi:transposase